MAEPLSEGVRTGLGISQFISNRNLEQERLDLTKKKLELDDQQEQSRQAQAQFEKDTSSVKFFFDSGLKEERAVELALPAFNRLAKATGGPLEGPPLTVKDFPPGAVKEIAAIMKSSESFKGDPGDALEMAASAIARVIGRTPGEEKVIERALGEVETLQAQENARSGIENIMAQLERAGTPEAQQALNNPLLKAAVESDDLERVQAIVDPIFKAQSEGSSKPFQARKDVEEQSRMLFGKGFSELGNLEKKIASDIAKDDRLDLALARTAGAETIKRKEKIAAAQSTLNALSDRADKVFTQSGILERIAQTPVNAVNQLLQTDPDAILYQSLSQGVLAMFVRAFGDVGTLNEGDIARARALTPKLFPIPDDSKVAKGKVKQLKELFSEIASRDSGSGTIKKGTSLIGFSKDGNPVLLMSDGNRVEITEN